MILSLYINPPYIAGKTVVCKQKALDEAWNNKYPTYFISLLATERDGKLKPERHLFDFATGLEWANTGVICMNVYDLHGFYKNENVGPAPDDAYELLKFFIEKHNGSNILVDEVPFVRAGLKGKTLIASLHCLNYYSVPKLKRISLLYNRIII